MMYAGDGGADNPRSEGEGESTIQFVIEELENLLLTVIEELRERPMVALALGAALLGACLGLAVAGRRSRPKPSRTAAGVVETLGPLAAALGRSRLRATAEEVAERAAKKGSKGRGLGGFGLGSSANLVNLGVRLLQNPIVRGYLLSMIGSRLRRARG